MADDLEVARAALRHAVENPESFTASEINAFSDVVERAQSQPTSLPEVTIVGDRDAKPELSTPLTRSPEPPTVASLPRTDRAAKLEATESAHAKWADDLFDPKAATASKVRELARDPEYHPPIPQHDGMVEKLLHPLDSINAAARLVGGADRVYEPSLDQFRRDMGPHLGERAGQLDESSREYKMYADAQWLKAYEQAKAEGKSIIRQAYHQDKGWGERVVSGAHDVMANGVAGLHGAADAMTMGAAPKLVRMLSPDTANEMASLDETHRPAHVAGEIAGAIAPAGLTNAAVRAGGNVLRGAGLVGAAPSIAKSIGAGAAIGATDTAGRAAVDAADGQGFDANQVAKDSFMNALLGGGVGGAGHLVAAGAGKMVSGLRERLPELAAAEGLGGETSMLRGFVPGKRYEALRQEAAATPGRPSPVGLLAYRLEQPLAEQGAITAAQGKAATAKVNEAYYAAHGDVRRPVDPLLNAATELHAGYHGPDGAPLPGQHERAVGMLRGEIGKMADLEVVPDSHPGAMSFAEARKRGFDVDKYLAKAPPEVREHMLTDMLGVGVVPVPGQFNPRETDTIVSGLDQALKAAQGPGGGPHPELNRLLEASRAVRDQFPDHPTVPGGNWSQFKHAASEQMAAEAREAEMAGVPGAMRGSLTANEAKRLYNNVAGYGDRGRHPEIDASLDAMAKRAGGQAPQDLSDIARVKAVESMQDKRGVFAKVRGGSPLASLSATGTQLRLDPLARATSRVPGASVAAGAVGAQDQPDAPRPLTFDEINRLLSPFGQY